MEVRRYTAQIHHNALMLMRPRPPPPERSCMTLATAGFHSFASRLLRAPAAPGPCAPRVHPINGRGVDHVYGLGPDIGRSQDACLRVRLGPEVPPGLMSAPKGGVTSMRMRTTSMRRGVAIALVPEQGGPEVAPVRT